MIIFFCILAALFALAMIGDKEKDNRRNYTIAFLVSAILAVLLKFYGF